MYFYSETTVEFEQSINQSRQQFLDIRMFSGKEGANFSLANKLQASCLVMVAHGTCDVILPPRYSAREEDVIHVPVDKIGTTIVEFTSSAKVYVLYYRSIDQLGRASAETQVFTRTSTDSAFGDISSLIDILICENRRKKNNWQSICDSITDIIFMQLWRNVTSRKTNLNAPDEQPAEAVKRYIDENYMQKLTLSSIAKALFISESTVSHSFSTAYRQSVAKYLLNVRIEASKRLLIETNLPISEIALRTGFGSLTTYYRNFNSFMGMSPSSYRSENLKKTLSEEP